MGNQRLVDWQIRKALEMMAGHKHQRIICEQCLISPNTLQLIKKHFNYFQITPTLKRVFLAQLSESNEMYQTDLGRDIIQIENILTESRSDRIKKVILQNRQYELAAIVLKSL